MFSRKVIIKVPQENKLTVSATGTGRTIEGAIRDGCEKACAYIEKTITGFHPCMPKHERVIAYMRERFSKVLNRGSK
jgi:hypothetical protein